jgi:hypothetical protein
MFARDIRDILRLRGEFAKAIMCLAWSQKPLEII